MRSTKVVTSSEMRWSGLSVPASLEAQAIVGLILHPQAHTPGGQPRAPAQPQDATAVILDGVRGNEAGDNEGKHHQLMQKARAIQILGGAE